MTSQPVVSAIAVYSRPVFSAYSLRESRIRRRGLCEDETRHVPHPEALDAQLPHPVWIDSGLAECALHHLAPETAVAEGCSTAAEHGVLLRVVPDVVDLARREEPRQLAEDVAQDRATTALPPGQVENLASGIRLLSSG